MSTTPLEAGPATLDRIRQYLVGLKMPRALEALEHILRRLERGELSAGRPPKTRSADTKANP